MANLNPQTTLAILEARRTQETEEPVLEPSFPYAKIHFDAAFFSADREVDRKEEGT